MVNRAVMLACSRYFLDCPQLCLTETSIAKGTRDDSAMGSMEGVFAVGISIWGVSVGVVSAEGGFA